jgi:hypothetical protein
VANANELLDSCHQKDIFLEVEDNALTAEEFHAKLSTVAGKELTYEQVKAGWLGFMIANAIFVVNFIYNRGKQNTILQWKKYFS